MKRSTTIIGGWCALGLCCASASAIEFAIVPVTASGSHTISGNEILLDTPDQYVILDITVSDWDPNDKGILARAYQAVVDPAGYTSGLRGVLTPFLLDCNLNSDCTAALGGGTCGGANVPPNKCQPGFINTSRTDYIFLGRTGFTAVDLSTLRFRYIGALQTEAIPNTTCVGGIQPGAACITDDDCPGFEDLVEPGTCEIDRSDRYLASLVLAVPPDALGTFTVRLDPAPETRLDDENGLPIAPQQEIPVKIIVKCQTSADCNDDNACTDDTCLPDGTCDNSPNFNEATECCNPADGTTVLIDDGLECTDDVCDADTGTVTHPPLPAGTACGDPTDTECDGADTCDGAGTCDDNLVAAGTACGDPTETDCDLADTCDGVGTCDPNLVAAGTPCGSSLDDACTDPDTCDDSGTCQPNHAPDGTACDDGLFCNENEACAAGVCTGGTAVDCDDGLPCTTDSCNEDLDQCDNVLDSTSCLISGVCYADGELNPANDCEECDPTLTQTDWSFRPAGAPCDDGDACTGTGRPGIGVDECDGAGTCAGVPDPECNDDCEFAIEASEGQTFSNNDNRAPDDAEASCQPDSNNDVWFFYTASCDGTIFMSTTGTTMVPSNDPVLSVWSACPDAGGTEIVCDDDSGVDLQAALIFQTAAGTTYWVRVAGFEDNTGDIVLNIAPVDDCVIDGVCYEAGALNAENDCEACVPELSTSAWSARPEGSVCGDPLETECDNPDACDGAGTCEVNHKPDGTLCSDDGNECTFDVCDAGACSHPPQPAGTACGDPTATECDNPDTCDGASACVPNFEPPGTPCGDPTTTQCDLADRCDGSGVCDVNFAADGTACDDGDVCTGDDQCVTGVCEGTAIPEAPLVEQEGSLHLFVTPLPAGSPAPVALHLTSPDWPCVDGYIDEDGFIVGAPVVQLPDDWGSVLVRGPQIAPDSTYEVVAECGAFTSPVGAATTAIFGDVVGIFEDGAWTDPNGVVDVRDILALLEVFSHLPTAPPLSRADIAPCGGDGVVDVRDVVTALDAFEGRPYPCELPCP